MTALAATMEPHRKVPPHRANGRGLTQGVTLSDPQDIPYGFCHCGCGQKTKPYRHTNATYGNVKGEPARSLSGHGYVKPLEVRFLERVDRRGPGECWEWTAGRTSAGYGRIYGPGREPLGAHRLAYELEFGAIPTGFEVCHHCDNPPCCNPAHLFVGTTKDNAADRERKGRGVHHEGNPQTKMTVDQVRAVRRRVASGERQADLAREFGVSTTNICDIIKGRIWRGIE